MITRIYKGTNQRVGDGPPTAVSGQIVGAENFIHVTRPGGIRRSCHRREPAFGRGTDQDRPVRVAVSVVPRRAATGEAGAGCCDTRSHVVSELVEEVWLMPET